MNVSKKRLFVGNLPSGVTEADISDVFSFYGDVVSVEIKQKKNNISQTETNTFAFVNLKVDDRGLNECVREFGEQKWKGQYLKVTPAKESFMEQLQRERLEAQGQKSSAASVPDKSINIQKLREPNVTVKPNINIPTNNSESTSDSEDDVPKIKPHVNNIALKKTDKLSDFQKDKEKELLALPIPGFIIKNNSQKKLLNGKTTRIESGLPEVEAVEIPTKELNAQAQLAEQKRINSLKDKKTQYNQQKQLLQRALSKNNTKLQNKIVFDDNGNDTTTKRNKKTKKQKLQNNNIVEYEHTSEKQSKYSLFNENDDDENNYNFKIREQFEGENGQELLKLQSRYTNDERFMIDSRFVNNVGSYEQDSGNMEVDETEGENIQRLENLGAVGKATDYRNVNVDRNRTTKNMLRYDPTKPEHSKFVTELQVDTKLTKTKMNKPKEVVEEIEEPIVSKEKFYKVTSSFKESLQENNAFSLLGMFGTANQKDIEKNEKYRSDDFPQKKIDHAHNPFRYDSSESEDEDGTKQKVEQNNYLTPTVDVSPMGMWKGTFFFEPCDQRIKDGVTFFHTQPTLETESFNDLRTELREIIRYKVRRDAIRALPVKKFLGGNRSWDKNCKLNNVPRKAHNNHRNRNPF